ncbi:Translation initiation factor IF-2 [Sulfidibacter corallicola]|uniref:Translation initiation factor IF-2 n=1 Tax=Sulfidibacter corallicola TaxID=2818388 RepID=A0A8A4TVM7_SULCO|nr:translation initiation factor IF-2 [Sulfidibacter corallicola]QTD53543.1 translation initiation factor IF-2 [Sulfidibacter corallicola]
MAVRVYQIAKEYSRSPEEVMEILRSSGIPVSSHTAVLDQHALHTVRAKLGKFKLTVVDGDQEAPVKAGEGEQRKAAPKGKAKAKAAPKLGVRVIKRDHTNEPEAAEVEAKPVAEEKPDDKPKLKRPKLKRGKRSPAVEQRIHQIAEKRQRHPSEGDEQAPAQGASPAQPSAEAKPGSGPARARAHESRDRGRPSGQDHSRPSGPRDSGGPRDRGGDRPSGDRRDYRGGDRGGDRGPRDYRGGDRDGRGGQRPPMRGGPGDRRPQGGPGDRRPQGGPGDRRPHGGPGDRRPQGGPGDRRPHGGPGDRRPHAGPGDRRPHGSRPPGGPGDRRPHGGPGDRRPHGGPGGNRPHGNRPGGARGGRPGKPPTTEMLREQFSMQQPTPAAGGMGKGPMRLKATGKPGGARGKKKKKKRNVENIAKIKPISVSKVELPGEELGIIMLSEGVTVKELAEKVDRKSKDVIKRLFEKGIMATLNHTLDSELAIEIAKDFGYEAEIVSFEEDLQLQEDESLISAESTDNEDQITRAPIVTIMGHVDHGKTTLLDAIRSTRVASGEAGGITQHIGAYSVQCNEKDIVFLDTPGHEAFTKMRARGASVTDIVILVVAADDGVKPQTIEAISHAKAAKVPIIVCINKIDKPEANPDRVKQMLTEHDLIVEDFGGDSPSVAVSAKARQGIDELLEMILLVAELNDYKSNPNRKAQGTVIEAQLDRGRGPVATLIVQDGTLKVGDFFITGSTYGKIRAMHDDLGHNVEVASPATPVEVLGIQEVPSAGDIFRVVDDEATARQISSFRKEKVKEDQFRRQKHTSLDQLFSNLKQDEIKELCLIIKADVQGSVEGLVFALNKLESEKVNLRVVHQGVGSITENDVLLAAASDSIIIGFNVKGERKAMDLAEQEQIDVHFYSVIYEVVKEIEAAMVGLIAPEYREREIGKAVVKQIFQVAKLGAVAGCYVEQGVVKRDAGVRVMRGQDEIFKGDLQTLKRFRDDVNEVKSGFECGIGIRDFSDFNEQDLLVFFDMEKIIPTKL